MNASQPGEDRSIVSRISIFIVTTLVRGIVFLVPIALVAVLAREGFGMLHRASQTLARWLPRERVFGLLPEDLITFGTISLVFLVAGLFVGTRLGQMLSVGLERAILYRVPGYLLVRGAVGNFPGLSGDVRPEPALAETDDGWAFAMLVERLPGGFHAVFLPAAPTPTSGSVRIVEASRVRALDGSMLNLLACLTRSGTGVSALVGSTLDDRAPDGPIHPSDDSSRMV
jgi:uncharacterized membrane protein